LRRTDTYHLTAVVILQVLLSGPLLAQTELERVLDLRGSWKFAIGDELSWAKADFDDSHWDEIHVPDFWEDQGYPGYDGWAWYRTRFVLAPKLRNEALFLNLGNIDDIDEVYVNGRFVAFNGQPPPDYITTYAETRLYYVPNEYLRFGDENTIAVRVYDHEWGGGIIRGEIGLYRDRGYLVPDQSLRGTWKLATGDDPKRSAADFDDSDWMDVLVPALWETQGLKGYDGVAWYRREFLLDPELRGASLLLLLGKIDDEDEVWFNGRRIGRTGITPRKDGTAFINNSYLVLRAYPIPSQLIRSDGRNVIAVRVYDIFFHGGIYQGPIGLVRTDRYRQWNRTHKTAEKNGLEKFLDALFGR
jgi:hypothetical protein